MADKGKRQNILRWRGLMARSSRGYRLMVFAVLVVASFALTATGLGFVEFAAPGGHTGYILTLLQPIALAALLFGLPYAMLLGFVSGAVLYVHSQTIPLSYYELMFVSPTTSMLLMTLAGLLLGLLFAFVLRNNPGLPKRYFYIALVCVVVSLLYSIAFITNVAIDLLSAMEAEISATTVSYSFMQTLQDQAVLEAFSLGSLDIQAWCDALLMIAMCLAGDFVAGKIDEWHEDVGMRTLFNVWLLIVVAIAFMITSSVVFVFITQVELDDFEKTARSEAEYLCYQLENESDRMLAVEDLLEDIDHDFSDYSEADWEAIGDLYQRVSLRGLLDGYTVDNDGIVIVTQDNILAMTDVVGINDYAGPIGRDLEDIIWFGQEEDALVLTAFNGLLLASDYASEDTHTRKDYELIYAYSKKAEENPEYSVTVIMSAKRVFAERSGMMAVTTVLTLLLLLVVYLMIARLLNRSVLRRIVQTNEVLKRITDGDLDAHVRASDTREFKSLATGINTTVGALKGWIAEAETRMDAELATAKSIQGNALPRIFPPYPDILRFDIYASMQPAREVGGDFYDFFLVGDSCTSREGRLAFVVADVSGKGVPAALFMMKAMAEIRNYVQNGMELGEAIENANRQLCDGNDAGMFVTAWVGVLDYGTGHLDYVNAGHNPPLLWSFDREELGAGRSSGSWGWLTQRSGLPLGLFDGMPYTAHSIDCLPGEQLLIYTDGVTEAMDTQGNLFGEERLESLLKDCQSLHPRELVGAVREGVAAHAHGAEQSDDITVLSIEVGVPPELTATLALPAEIAQLPRVNAFIHNELDRRLCPMRAQNQLDVAVEEMFVNVCNYAYPEGTGQVRVSYTYSAEPPSVRVEIADDGIPYDPLAKPDAVTPDDIKEVPIGGLGILMAKRSVDEMTYRYEDGSNITTLVKRW